MAKIVLPDASNGNSGTQRINDNFRKVAEALNDKVLFRDNPPGEPNEMNNDLDMNSNRVYNLPVPTLDHEATPWGEVKDGLPAAKEYAEQARLSALAAALSAAFAALQANRAESEADRAEDAADSVAGAIGRIDELEEKIDERVGYLPGYAQLRASPTEVPTTIRVTSPRIQGDFVYDPLDTTSLDNGGTIIVDGLGRRWKRLFEGPIKASWFGTVGDGVADDGPAIRAALQFAQGRPVKLQGGETYQLTSQINDPIDIDLSSDGTRKAVIRGVGQSFRPFRIEKDTPDFIRNLNTNTEINNHYWGVDDLTGIQPGMLMEIVSSKDWYFKEAVAMKSELHRVVGIQHGFVQAERAANDGYEIASETVVAKFYTPLKLRLENLEFRLDHVPNQRNGCAWFGTTSGARIIDCDFINGSLNGLTLERGYDAQVIGGHVQGTNGTMGATGAVYGVILWGCTDSKVDGTKFSANYAGVNVTGNDVISLNCTVQNTTVTGGGYSNEDLALGWDQQGVYVRNQRGHGSRGPSDGTKFFNNTFSHMDSAIVGRGRNIIIQDNVFQGRYRTGCIELYLGTNCVIQDNIMDPSFFSGKSTFTWDGLNINTHLPDVFLSIQRTWTYGNRNPVVVKGNRAVVSKAFIELYDVSGVAHVLRVSDNDVSMYAENPTDTLPLIWGRNPTVTLSPAAYISQTPPPVAGAYARMQLFSPEIQLQRSVSIHNWSESYTPTVVTSTDWTDPVISPAFLTIEGQYAKVDFTISGGTVTAESGDVYSVQVSVPYIYTSFSSTDFIRGTATGLGKSGLVSSIGSPQSAKIELLNDGSTTPIRVSLTYRIG